VQIGEGEVSPLANGGRPWGGELMRALMGKGVENLGYFGKIFWEFGGRKEKEKKKERKRKEEKK